METTRQTILSILRRRRRATVDELTKELGLAPATVRRHLDILARDSHVEVSQVRRKTGRPHPWHVWMRKWPLASPSWKTSSGPGPAKGLSAVAVIVLSLPLGLAFGTSRAVLYRSLMRLVKLTDRSQYRRPNSSTRAA